MSVIPTKDDLLEAKEQTIKVQEHTIGLLKLQIQFLEDRLKAYEEALGRKIGPTPIEEIPDYDGSVKTTGGHVSWAQRRAKLESDSRRERDERDKSGI